MWGGLTLNSADACGCCSAPSSGCVPTCASPGTVDVNSGSRCTDCGTQKIIDHFGGALDPAWQCGLCGGNICGTSGGQVQTFAGVLDMGGGSCLMRSFAKPAAAGFCVEVKAKIVQINNGTGGITLAYGRYMFGRKTSLDYGIQHCIDGTGCIASGSTISTVGAFANGDIISFIFRDQGSANGVCTVCYLVNGSVVAVEKDVITNFCNPMFAGVQAFSGSNTRFDDFEVRTS